MLKIAVNKKTYLFRNFWSSSSFEIYESRFLISFRLRRFLIPVWLRQKFLEFSRAGVLAWGSPYSVESIDCSLIELNRRFIIFWHRLEATSALLLTLVLLLCLDVSGAVSLGGTGESEKLQLLVVSLEDWSRVGELFAWEIVLDVDSMF